MKHLLFLTLITVLMFSCKPVDKKAKINPLAISYNNQAFKQLQTKNYDSALVLINKALSVDSSYIVGYISKVAIYLELKDYKNALIVEDKALQIDSNYAEGYLAAGSICEKVGDSIRAFDYYKKGIDCYDRRISNPIDQKQLINSRLNRACLLRFSGKEMEGKSELEKLKVEKQDTQLIDGFLKMDRKTYLSNLQNK